MRNANPKSRKKRWMPASLGLALLTLAGLVVISEAGNAGASPPLANTPLAFAPKPDSGACGNLSPEEVYARLKKETLSITLIRRHISIRPSGARSTKFSSGAG